LRRQERAPHTEPSSKVLEEYECPICLGVLHSPVVLTCAHRFCWGCLLTCATRHLHSLGHDDGAGFRVKGLGRLWHPAPFAFGNFLRRIPW
jgi:RING-type zinc-finger